MTITSRLASILALVAAALVLAGCGGGGASGSTPPSATKTTATVAALSLGTSSPTVKSDNSNSATITVSALDASNGLIPGVTVNLSATSGQLSASSGTTDSKGLLQFTYSAGSSDARNRTATIMASMSGSSITTQIPILVAGSTLSLQPSTINITAGGTSQVVVTAKNAAGTGVNAQTIRFSIAGSSSSQGTVTPATVTTDASGVAPAVKVSGDKPGVVTVAADWLDSAGVSTLSASTDITVTGSVSNSFDMITPASDPSSLKVSVNQTVSITVPASVSGTAVARVRYATTLGAWQTPGNLKVMTVGPPFVDQTFVPGIQSGIATIQIDALDAGDNVLTSLKKSFAISAVAPALISLQPSVSNVAPSVGGNSNSATLTATVRDAANNTVANAAVLFELLNPTGSGESISPAIAYTNASGQASATFYSGALSTVGGLGIKASVVGVGISDVKLINVGGTAVSVSLGAANKLQSVNNDTAYDLAVSVLVVSNTGAAVKDAVVTLSAFPTFYYKGSRDQLCAPVYTLPKPPLANPVADPYAMPNEDINENDILDPGEDSPQNNDGIITPPHSAAGSVPTTATTDANGVGVFHLIYQKQYANWIMTRLRAKVVVSGTESVGNLSFILSYLISDASPCTLPNSPFN